VIAGALMIYVTWYAHRHGIGRDQAFRWATLGMSFIFALPALMTPVIIIGGMSSGAFTPTEAAVAACAWALLLGLLLYRSLSWRQFYRITIETIETTASVLIIVGAASLFGWILTTTRVTEALATALLSVTTDPLLLLLIINLLLLIVGCFMETIAAISILVPILMPVVLKAGIDPVQFGVVMVLNLMIGLLTPPVGMVLFVLARVAKLSFDRTVMAVLPLLVPLLIVLVLISLIPQLTLWLPTLWYR
jgi:tripartite ATP-independent transporter DctM subunit